MKSIQRTLLSSITAITIAALLGVGVHIYQSVSSELASSFDRVLMDKAKAFMVLTEFDPVKDEVELEFADELMPEFDTGPSLQYFQMISEDGSIIEKSRSFGDLAFPVTVLDETKNGYFSDLVLPDGRNGRSLTIHFRPRHDLEEDDPVPVVTKLSPLVEFSLFIERDSLDKQLNRILKTIFITIFASTLTLVILLYFIVQRGLSPLNKLASKVGGFNESNISQKFQRSQHSGVKELEPIEQQLDSLLDRLSDAFERVKRFSSDAAHELYTPITELKTASEVAKRSRQDDASVKEFLNDSSDIANQMQAVVKNLLALTRIDNTEENICTDKVELSGLVNELCKNCDRDTTIPIIVVNAIEPGLYVVIDKEKLRIILRNILNNARRYSIDGTEVKVFSCFDHSIFTLTIENHTNQLCVSDLDKMKRRFWRKDPARTSGLNSGLGLSVADSFAKVIGLNLELSLSAEHIFTAKLSGFHAV